MAIIKPTKPDSELPKTWGGIQYPYTEEQIAEGLPEAIPTIIDGGTLNYEKKGVFERMEYVTQVSDAVAGAPIKKTLITNANNQFEYAGIGVYSYSATQVYALDDFVITSTNDGTKIYKSLSNNNIGKELTNETYWEELSLGGGGGGGLEIGDIGFTPLDIDEAQNKRRYLNGQVISQAQFVSFTNKIKSAVKLNPSLATSETNWQAEVTNSPYGICGKFVIDDNTGTIRLPKYPDWSIREVGQAPVVGNGMTLGLYNNKGTYSLGANIIVSATSYNVSAYGVPVGTNISNSGADVTGGAYGVTTDPTKSGIIADLTNANTENKLQGKWFIQVATGVVNKANTSLSNVDSNIDSVVEKYGGGNGNWYIRFKSGLTFQGIYASVANGVVNLLVDMTTNEYGVVCTTQIDSAGYVGGIYEKTTSSFKSNYTRDTYANNTARNAFFLVGGF